MVRTLLENSAGMRWAGKNLTQTSALMLAIYAGTFSPVGADQQSSDLLQRYEAKLTTDQHAAQKLLVEGDSFYEQANYKQATELYQKACSLVQQRPATSATRKVAVERFAQAVVERCVQLRRVGQYDEARTLLKLVLSKDIAPNHSGAKQALAMLEDPIRTNPALTVEGAREAEAAGKWLRKAEGFYNLGKFDEALMAYEEVLHLDPYNRAARRGMERVNLAVSNYADSAYDHSRSEMLNGVAAAWETANNFKSDAVLKIEAENAEIERLQKVRGSALRNTLIPVVDFEDTTLSEAVDVMRLWTKNAASAEAQALNFVINLNGASDEAKESIAEQRFSLQLKNIPLSEVLDLVTEAIGAQWKVGDYAVQITPNGATDTTISRRTFIVPPTFLLDAKSPVDADEADPFADTGTALRKKVTAKEFLASIGVTFPEGTTAQYIPATSSLIVKNTSANLELVESYVNSYKADGNTQVVMKLTFIETRKENLEELGFDWLVSADSDPGSNVIFGGGNVGNGFDIPQISIPQNPQNYSPISSGNRSGDSLFSSSTIDSAINGTLGQSSRGPGIMSLSTNDFQVIMRGLNQRGDSSRIDTTTIVARSGHTATMFSGREFIYPTEYEPPELPNSVRSGSGGTFPVTPATPTAFETRQVGLELEAEATVSDDSNYIDVQIKPQRVDFDGFVNYGSPITSSVSDPITGLPIQVNITDNEILQPVFRRVEIKGGQVRVRDGAHFVIGGLIDSSIETVEDKIPIVGDAPVIGRLFRSEASSKVDKVLLIIVNVELQDPTGKPIRAQL